MSSVSLVYLDIDGVLVTDRPTKLGGAGYIPPGAITMLLDLLERSGAKSVIASTSRDADCRARLSDAGIGRMRYFADWRTPEISPDALRDMPVRGQEIDRHPQHHQPSRYVVLDDDPGMLPHQKSFHIQVDPSVRLTWDNVEDAKRLLVR